MNNADMPAAPIGPYQYVNEDGSFVNGGASGLTKREHFAGLAMQSMIVFDVDNRLNEGTIAKVAVNLADALLAELDKVQQ
jgi:hypothetical protein